MIEKWKKGNKIVIAERINRTDDYLNIFLSNFYSFIIRLFFFKNYPKKNFDIALIDSHYLFHFKNNLETSYIPFKIYSLGLDISKVSYIRLPREFGKSKFTFLKRLEIIFEIFFSYSKISFRLFFLFGVMLSFFSFFYALFIVSYNLTNPVEVKGFPTIAFLLSFFSGIILLLIAILGEFILKVYNQNKNIETVNYKIFIDKIYKR
jgi:dolichol-phosphate mannosyltransferase